MADQERRGETPAGRESAGRGELRQDALVERLAPDPGQHEPAATLAGFLGKAAREGAWRLYLSPRLDEYVEFAAEDVLHAQPLPAEQSPLGGTQVWLRAGASLRHTQISSRQVQANFLQGELTSAFMGAARPTMPTFGRLPETGVACTRNYVCSVNPHIPACQPRSEICGSLFCPATGALCPTGDFIQTCGGYTCNIFCA